MKHHNVKIVNRLKVMKILCGFYLFCDTYILILANSKYFQLIIMLDFLAFERTFLYYKQISIIKG